MQRVFAINVRFVLKQLVDSIPAPNQVASAVLDPSLAVYPLTMVGRNVFDYIHRLNMQFHLGRNTGQLSRILD